MEIVKEEVEQKVDTITEENLICAITYKDGNLQIVTNGIEPKQLLVYLSQSIVELVKQIK